MIIIIIMLSGNYYLFSLSSLIFDAMLSLVDLFVSGYVLQELLFERVFFFKTQKYVHLRFAFVIVVVSLLIINCSRAWKDEFQVSIL